MTITKSERPGADNTEALKTKTLTSRMKAGRAKASASEPEPSMTVVTEESVQQKRDEVRQAMLNHINALKLTRNVDHQVALAEYERRILGPVPTTSSGSIKARLAYPELFEFAGNLVAYIGNSCPEISDEPCTFLSMEEWDEGETSDAVYTAVFKVQRETLRRFAICAGAKSASFGAVLAAVINEGVDHFIRECETAQEETAPAPAAALVASKRKPAKENRAMRGITFAPLTPPATIGLSAAAPAAARKERSAL